MARAGTGRRRVRGRRALLLLRVAGGGGLGVVLVALGLRMCGDPDAAAAEAALVLGTGELVMMALAADALCPRAAKSVTWPARAVVAGVLVAAGAWLIAGSDGGA
ncbi:MAG: hypothetical protein ACLFVN_09550 [Phycisphaeraceae bacterium]